MLSSRGGSLRGVLSAAGLAPPGAAWMLVRVSSASGESAAAARSRRLALPAGFRADHALRSLCRDAGSPTERRTARGFARAALLDGRPALVHVDLRPKTLALRVEAARPVSPRGEEEAVLLVRRLLGLDADVEGFERRALRTRWGRRLLGDRAGMRIPLTSDPWEAVVWSVVAQQVNLAFAFSCRLQVIELCGRRVPGGLRAHPPPSAVARLEYADLTARKFSRRKAEYLIDLARALASAEEDLGDPATETTEAIEARLLAVRGLGPWSVQYVLMRGHGLPDCVPVGDVGLMEALKRFHSLPERPDPARTRALLEPLAPHRSLAVFHLWKTLGDPA